MRKANVFLVIILILVLMPITAYSEKLTPAEVNIKLDGEPVDLGSYELITKDDRLLIPIRWVSEKMGGTVDWDQTSRSVTVSLSERTVTMFIDDYFGVIDGQEVFFDTQPIVVDGHTMVPLRTVAEALQSEVVWSEETNTVKIMTGQQNAVVTSIQPVSLDQEDLKWLAAIIYLESKGEPFEGQVAVGSVVMNRVKSGLFPTTIKEVIFQENQFNPVTSGAIYKATPDATAYKAAKWAMIGKDLSKGALFFYNPRISTSTFFKNKITTTVIANHTFVK